jgi:hypothetical protein
VNHPIVTVDVMERIESKSGIAIDKQKDVIQKAVTKPIQTSDDLAALACLNKQTFLYQGTKIYDGVIVIYPHRYICRYIHTYMCTYIYDYSSIFYIH